MPIEFKTLVLITLYLLGALLQGCTVLKPIFSADNQVEHISHEGQRIAKETDGRYENLFPGFEQYPFTCAQDCYAPHPDLVCQQAPYTDCRYSGARPKLNLDIGFSITWLGHASFLIKDKQGQTFLFDPVSQQFDWPVNWAHALTGGQSRRHPNWLDEASLQDVDAVLYSHLHYDHFNKSDIHELGSGPRYFVHQDTADYLPNIGLLVSEMTWFADSTLGGTRVVSMPAHHFNSRFFVPYVYDDNEKALWGGWLLEHQGAKVFFAGDTGYSPHFQTIAEQIGPIDICLIPIASYYHPKYAKWYRYVHTTPEDALLAAKEMQCKVMIPWGYGNASWQMGDRASHSPLLRLLNMHGLVAPEQTVLILDEGESVNL